MTKNSPAAAAAFALQLPTLSLAVVGADYANKRGPSRRFEIALCRPGEPVELRPEPKNKADARAIAVYSERGIQIGYITAARAPWLQKIMREGHEIRAVFQANSRGGAIIRAAFDGENPTLPSNPADSPPDDSGFWPDEIPPDK